MATAMPETPPAPDRNEISALMSLLNMARFGEAELQTRAQLASYPEAGMLWKILGVALMRQGKDALLALRKASELLPQDAEAHGNLGAALHDLGQWAQALESLHRSLALNPDNADTLLDAANASKALGRLGEAVELYQRALALGPDLPEAHNNLGNAHLERGEFREAAQCYRRALRLKPQDATIHCNLGNALRELGELEAAERSTHQAMLLDPALSVAYNNLGLIRMAQGRREEAVIHYRRALQLNPRYVQALNNVGTALNDLGARREAAAAHAHAISLDPSRPESHCNLGNVLIEMRRFEEAVGSFGHALALKPDFAAAHLSLAAALRQLGRAAQAEASCRAALAIEPNSAAALSVLAELHADRGRFQQAEELLERAISLDPGFPFPYFSIASHRKMSVDDTRWLEGTTALFSKPLTLRHQISLRYALGKYFDDIEQYDAAFAEYRQANELTQQYGVKYDPAAVVGRNEAIMSRFTPAAFTDWQPHGDGASRPVFIVGMPRSGTTLMEQILASHPEVFGAGELPFWQTAFGAFESNGAALIPTMTRDYLAGLSAFSGTAQRVIDKMPQNFVNLGLIHAALPNAKIIHMQRHPIDTCLSIYFHYFSHLHPYANDLRHLAHYYREYVRLMAHWRAVLPAETLLEIPYESLIEDQEAWTRRALDFLELPFDPRCLDFHRTERVVITFSKWQVRQKISASSVGRWRHYHEHIGPLRELA
jgi:tetratricopeptide (TPR) repeat protein